MRGFARKLGQSLITLWGVSLVIFCLLFVVPRWKTDPDGKHLDPTDAIAQTFAGAHATDENIANIKTRFGLESLPPNYERLPFIKRLSISVVTTSKQYFHFMDAALTNNLKSFRNGDLVFSAIGRRFFNTLVLAVTALCVYLAVAIPVSLLTASRSGSFLDRSFLFLSLVAVSIPTFWLGRILQNYLGYQLNLFSVGGGASLWNLPLPAMTLGIGGAAYYSRLLHANLRGVLKQDYIRAARARGLSETQVLGKHALKNALLPALAVLGLEFSSLLSGLIFTEKIFGWPGIGSLAIDAVMNQDVPMIMGTVLFSALMVVISNLLVDALSRLVDPRVKA